MTDPKSGATVRPAGRPRLAARVLLRLWHLYRGAVDEHFEDLHKTEKSITAIKARG